MKFLTEILHQLACNKNLVTLQKDLHKFEIA